MAFRVRLLEVRDRELRAVLQGVEVLVAEHLPHVQQGRATADNLGRATGAERVRRDRDRQVEPVGVGVQPFEECVVGQAFPRARELQRALGRITHEERAHTAQVARHEAQRGLPDGHEALLATLAHDERRRVVEVDVSDVEAKHLGGAHARRVEQFDERAIRTPSALVVPIFAASFFHWA